MRTCFSFAGLVFLVLSAAPISLRAQSLCDRELFARRTYGRKLWLGKKVWVPRGPGKPPSIGVISRFDENNRAEITFISESNREPGTFSSKRVEVGQLRDLQEATPSEIARSPNVVDGTNPTSFNSIRPGENILIVSGAEEVYRFARVIENNDGWMKVEVFDETGRTVKTLRFYRKGMKAILRYP